jgi:hypothetical protein
VTRGGPWPSVGFAAVAIAAAAVLSHPAPRVEEVFHFTDPAIDESSGLAVLHGLVLTIDDSGAGPVVYAVDPATGDTVGRTTYSPDAVEDVEALGVAPDGTVWVADIGDNGADRDAVSLYAVPGVGRGDRTVTAHRYDLVYPDGPRDAETLLVDPRDGRLTIVSKGLFGGAAYAVPRHLREGTPNRLHRVAAVDGLLTDGTTTADGRHALLRGYGRLYVADTRTWRYLADMRLPDQRQGEGITLGDDPEHVLLSSEGAGTAVLAVRLGKPLLEALHGAPAGDGPRTTPAGSRDAGSAEDPGPPATEVAGLAAGGALALAALVGTVVAVRGARRRSRSTP